MSNCSNANENDIDSDITAYTVNLPSRIHHTENKEPRVATMASMISCIEWGKVYLSGMIAGCMVFGRYAETTTATS